MLFRYILLSIQEALSTCTPVLQKCSGYQQLGLLNEWDLMKVSYDFLRFLSLAPTRDTNFHPHYYFFSIIINQNDATQLLELVNNQHQNINFEI